MLSLTALLLASCAAPSPAYATGEPPKLPPEPYDPPSRRLSMAEATSIIHAELVASPRATLGEVKAYVQARAVQLMGRQISVSVDPAQPTRAPLDMVPAKTRRRRERLAARVSASSMSTP